MSMIMKETERILLICQEEGRLWCQSHTEGQWLELSVSSLGNTVTYTNIVRILCPVKSPKQWEERGIRRQDELTTQETLLLKDFVQTFQWI